MISVVIPTYNSGPTLRETLGSVLAQTVEPLEILVVDDGSTDGTADWVESQYGEKVRVIRQQNQGVAAARNRGLQEARGEFIAYLDHDDIWSSQKLERQLAAMRDGVGVIYCGWEQFDSSGVLTEGDKRFVSSNFENKLKIELEDLLLTNLIISMSVPLIRTEKLREIGGFDAKTVPCDDWDLWLRLAEKTTLIGVNETLVRYRQHDAQQSGDISRMWVADRRVRWKNWRNALRHPRLIYRMYKPNFFIITETTYRRVKNLVSEGQFRQAAKMTFSCLIRHPIPIFTSQWSYLILKILKRDSRKY